MKTIKKRTEEKTKLEALFDYDHNLREYSPQKFLPLLREVSFSEGGFVQGTPDKWHPIQIEFFHKQEKAQMKFHWRMPGSSSTVFVPSEYFRTQNF